MKFTYATEADVDFITDAVFAAVKSGSETLSYSTIFEKEENELKPLFKEMLLEDVEGQELWLSGFMVARDENGNPAATCCAWIEGEEGPSAMLTAQVLAYGLGSEVFKKATEKNAVVESLRVDREEGALQFEHVYTAPQYRGKGLAAMVIAEQIKEHKQRLPALQKAQIILFKTNDNALNAYQKIGFTIAREIRSNHPEVLTYFPSDTRVLMELNLAE
ncbi:MAG: GNAT family N-acetyltransferase [Bacteroidota bacterium]